MKKLNTARLLMGLSILLIIIFQAYWLNKLYKEEKDAFHKTTDLAFRETIYRLQAERFKKDSLLIKGSRGENLFISDMVSEISAHREFTDSPRKMILSINSTHKGDDEPGKVFSDTTIMLSNDKGPARPGEIIRFLRSSNTINRPLSLRAIDSTYSRQLNREGISVPYIIKIIKRKDKPLQNTYGTPVVPVGILEPTYYQAIFNNPSAVLLKNIAPQIVLSLLLIALIAASFIFIYRNLVAQQKLTAIKNEFIANITHELKTPISTVSVAIEAMKNFNALKDPARTDEYLGIARLELNRLSLLVDKVLRLSMFENRQVEVDPRPFELDVLVQEVLNSMDLQFQKSDAGIEFTRPAGNFTIEADRMHISSVIYNLLDNALKYGPEKPFIQVSLSENANDIQLSVKDNGPGIDPAYKDKIFEKFFRVPSGNTHNVKGYGLGLSYAAHIVERHHGVIRVESDGKSGTMFIIQLPRRYAS